MHHLMRVLGAFALFITSMTAQAVAEALPSSAFAYDSRASLHLHVRHRSTTGGIVREDIAFATPGGGRMHAEIVSPTHAASKHPGVLFVHWLGDPATTNHTEFEPDALSLARRGITSLLVDAMWSQQHWFMRVRSTETDYKNSIAQVVNLRRALDVLQAQPGVDAQRLAYVGHDFGAMYGAVLSGVDSRPRWYALMAATPSFSEWYLIGKKPVDVAAYVAQMAPLNPGPYLARSHAHSYLFQFSQNDRYITPAEEMQFFAAAPLPKALYLYEADHSLKTPTASEDRLSWLMEQFAQR